jgi:hypothetical protein
MTEPHFGQSDDVDPRSPLFFLSYAHSLVTGQARSKNQGRNRRFVRFFEDLSENVAELVSRTAGSDPGYMDQSSIAAGRRWTPELLRALGTCQVFVALLSPIYIDSAWCSLEWHAFSRRQVTSYPDRAISNETAIIPVIWAPVREPDVPRKIQDVQWFYPLAMPETDKAASYEGDGVVGLLQIDEIAYQAVVWRLAQRIAEIHYTHRVEPRTIQIGKLRNVFKEQEG